MGLFYIDIDSERTLANQKEHVQEIQEIAKETLQVAEMAPDDLFPEFLWEAQLNAYEGDDYKLRGTCDNPNVIKAYSIRRKYSNYWDYVDAMEAYIDYAQYIESAYGSFDMMKNAADQGIGVIYIPKKPKLTNKKANKNLLKFGYIPSRMEEDFIPDSNIINSAIDSLRTNEVSTDEKYELPKSVAKLHEKAEVDKVKSARVGSIYARNSNGNLQGMDAIINFLNSANTDDIESRGGGKSSFSEEMESLHEFDYVPQEILDDMFAPKASYITSSFLMNPENERQKRILETLVSNEFSFLDKSATAGMDKDFVRAVTKRFSNYSMDTENLTPKQIKKLKKKEAKRRKKANERLIGDRRLQDALLKSRARLSMDENLNFRLCDVVPEDD